MNFAPLLAAPPAVKLHVATVLPALLLGSWMVFLSHKGARPHRALGWLYLGLMSVTACAALFIRSAAHSRLQLGTLALGPLHLFVLLTAWSVWRALVSLRRGDISGHRRAMLGLYFGGLLFAGLLTLLPGRIMGQVFFG